MPVSRLWARNATVHARSLEPCPCCRRLGRRGHDRAFRRQGPADRAERPVCVLQGEVAGVPRASEPRRGVRVAMVLGLLNHVPPGTERWRPLWAFPLCPLPCGWVRTSRARLLTGQQTLCPGTTAEAICSRPANQKDPCVAFCFHWPRMRLLSNFLT